VAGLLTGQDIIAQIQELVEADAGIDRSAACLVMPGCLLKAGEDILLDDCTVQTVAESLQMPVHVCQLTRLDC
jgi:NifB/MoaA-like Fe-S oxidoreductase